MDLSNDYVKMCEKAGEIQKLWKQKIGDYQASDDGLGGLDVMVTTLLSDDAVGKPDPNEVWLPRQDQLQEMVNGTLAETLESFHWFVVATARNSNNYMEFICDGDVEIINKMSHEQLWLAFVMKEKFNKTWTGEGWTVI